MDVHNPVMDIHYSVMYIHNSIRDIQACIMGNNYGCHNWIMDVNN